MTKAVRSMPRRQKSEAVQKALEVLNDELLFVIQSRGLEDGHGVGIWYTHKTLGDWRDDGTIQGKDRAYEKMDAARKEFPPRQWRVLQRDNLVFYQEGIRDRERDVRRFRQAQRMPRLALPDTMREEM